MQATTAMRNAWATAIGTAAGSGTAIIDVSTGASPGVGNADTGTPLVSLTGVTFASSANGAVSISATTQNGGNNGIPGHVRLKTNGGTAVMDFTAGVSGTTATPGTPVVTANAVTSCPMSSGGTGYTNGLTYPITFTGGGGTGASGYSIASGGALGSIVITSGGAAYTSAPVATVPPPFEFNFTANIALGGAVSDTSWTITMGNA